MAEIMSLLIVDSYDADDRQTDGRCRRLKPPSQQRGAGRRNILRPSSMRPSVLRSPKGRGQGHVTTQTEK